MLAPVRTFVRGSQRVERVRFEKDFSIALRKKKAKKIVGKSNRDFFLILLILLACPAWKFVFRVLF